MLKINPYEPGEVGVQDIPAGPIEYPGREIKLSIVYDMDYLIEAVNRFRSQGRKSAPGTASTIFRWASGLFLVCMATAAWFLAEMHMFWAPICLFLLGLASIFAPQIDNAVYRRRFRSISYLNHRFFTTLTDEGYFVESANQKVKFLWPVFTRVTEFSDGVLLYQGSQLYYWFPFRALENAEDSSILYRYIQSRLSAEKTTGGNQVAAANESLQSNAALHDSVGREIKVTIVNNEEFFRTSLARLGQRQRSWFSAIIRYTITIVFLCLSIMAALEQGYWVAAACLLIGVFVFFHKRIDGFFAVRRLRSSLHYNERLVITLSDKGFHALSPLQDITLGWDSIVDVSTYHDGILLMLSNRYGHWIPFHCLENNADAKDLYDYVYSRIIASRTQSRDDTKQHVPT